MGVINETVYEKLNSAFRYSFLRGRFLWPVPSTRYGRIVIRRPGNARQCVYNVNSTAMFLITFLSDLVEFIPFIDLVIIPIKLVLLEILMQCHRWSSGYGSRFPNRCSKFDSWLTHFFLFKVTKIYIY